MNTLSLSGAPCADDCLWHSIRASARIYTNHRYKSMMQILFSSILFEGITNLLFDVWIWRYMGGIKVFSTASSSPFLLRSPCHSCWASAPSMCGRKDSSAAARFPSHHLAQRRYRSGPAQSVWPLNSLMHCLGSSDKAQKGKMSITNIKYTTLWINTRIRYITQSHIICNSHQGCWDFRAQSSGEHITPEASLKDKKSCKITKRYQQCCIFFSIKIYRQYLKVSIQQDLYCIQPWYFLSSDQFVCIYYTFYLNNDLVLLFTLTLDTDAFEKFVKWEQHWWNCPLKNIWRIISHKTHQYW